MSRPTLNPGKLVWSGEHWINAVRTEGSTTPSGWFSLYHTRYSEEGEGNAAQVVIPGADIAAVYADNLELGRWIIQRFFAKSRVKKPDAPLIEARFRRSGTTRRDPAWEVETDEHRIVARWQVREPPVVAYGPFGDAEFFTLLFFTDESSVELDGHPIAGKPFVREIWKDSIGGDRSSSLFALAETLIEPAS